MPILNYTTKIDSYKTITEIQQILSKASAKKCVIDNDDEGNPVAITFVIEWNGMMTAFKLPCNFQGVLRSMQRNKKVPRSLCNQEQALRVGWRIVKDWVAAQIAIVEAELATLAEVFLPYAVTKDGTTLFEMVESNKQKLLANG